MNFLHNECPGTQSGQCPETPVPTNFIRYNGFRQKEEYYLKLFYLFSVPIRLMTVPTRRSPLEYSGLPWSKPLYQGLSLWFLVVKISYFT